MYESLYSNEERDFDRLVDGELSAAERRVLLESLDTRPDGWRRCAIAFLEAQTWGNDFRQIARESEQVREVVAAPVVVPLPKRGASLKQAIGWAAMAASLVVAFWLGASQRRPGAPTANVPGASQASHQIAGVDPAPSAVEEPGNPDVLTLWADDENGRRRSFRVPLMDAGQMDRQLGVEFQTGLPADVRSQLEGGGYQVHSKRRYAPLWLENGQRMVLPVEDTKIVPVSQNVY